MANIPTFTSKEIPSGQTGETFLSPRAADVGAGIEEQAFAELGQDVAGLGTMFAEIAERDRASDDILASDRAGQIRAEAEQDLALFKQQSKDANTWGPKTKEISEAAQRRFSELSFHDDTTAQRQAILQSGWDRGFNVQSQIQAVATKSKQAVALTAEAFTKDFVSGRNTASSEENLDKALIVEFGSAELAQDKKNAIIDEAEGQRKEAVLNATSDAAFLVWSDTVTDDNPDGDLNAAFDVIENSGIPAEDKQEAETELRTRVTNRRAESKFQLEQVNQEDRESIVKLFTENQYAGIDKVIEATSLNPTEKSSWMSKAATRAKAFNEGADDPFKQTDSKVYFDLRQKIAIDPQSVTEADLAAVVGLGAKDGIGIAEYEKLLSLIEPGNPLNDASNKRAQAAINRVRELDLALGFTDEELAAEAAGEGKYLQISNEYDKWVTENPNATDKQKEDKFQLLLQPEVEKTTRGFFNKTLRFAAFGLAGLAVDKARNRKEKKDREGTVKMVSPAGKIFIVPEEKKQRFLDNGFTEDGI